MTTNPDNQQPDTELKEILNSFRHCVADVVGRSNFDSKHLTQNEAEQRLLAWREAAVREARIEAYYDMKTKAGTGDVVRGYAEASMEKLKATLLNGKGGQLQDNQAKKDV